MAAPKNITQSRQELMAWKWQEKFRTDPYLAIMACFPWGVKGTPLEKFNGPRKWQVEGGRGGEEKANAGGGGAHRERDGDE